MELPIFFLPGLSVVPCSGLFGWFKLSRRCIMIHYFFCISFWFWSMSSTHLKKGPRSLPSSLMVKHQILAAEGFVEAQGQMGGVDRTAEPDGSWTTGIDPSLPTSSKLLLCWNTCLQLQKSLQLLDWIRAEAQKGALQSKTFMLFSEGEKSQKQVKGMGCSALWIAFQKAFFPK